jgi:hypothetical protein
MPGGHARHLVQHREATVDLVAGCRALLDGAGEILAEAGVEEVVVVAHLETRFGEEVRKILPQVVVHSLKTGPRVAVSRRFALLHFGIRTSEARARYVHSPGDAILARMKPGLALVTLTVLALAGCADRETPEERVRAVIGAAERAAEEREVGAAMELVARDYRDEYGFDRDGLQRFLRGWFVMNQSIRLLVRVEDVKFPADELAQARVTIGMLGTRGEGGEDWDLAAEIHELDVELVSEDGEWRVRRATLVDGPR